MSSTNKGGRPSKWEGDDTLDKVYEYLAKFGGKVDEDDAVYEVLPTVAGLSVHLGVHRDTLYAWSKDEDKEEFSDILSKLKALQEIVLVNHGLVGTFNSAITKMMLTKHGYSDKMDVTSNDEHITGGTKTNKDLAREIMFAMQAVANEAEDESA